MRTVNQIKRELTEARAIVDNADRIAPSYDNDGNLVLTAEQRLASARRRVTRLAAELAALERVFATPRQPPVSP